MRVTSNSFPSSLVNQLGQLSDLQNRLQTQISTGQRIQLPQDDPVATQQVLGIQTEVSTVAQQQSNIAHEQELASSTYNAINGLKTISDRANEIATLADGTKSPQDLATYASEVTELIKQGVEAANTQIGGSYLLAGTQNDQPPFSLTTDSNGLVTGVSYQGNTSLAENEVASGVTMSAQTLGANSTGNGPRGLVTDSRSGADLFNHLIALQNHLTSGDTSTIASQDRANLSKDEDNLLFHVSANSAVQARLEAASSSDSDRTTSLQQRLSSETSADMAQTIVRLNQTQNAYRAALASGSQILNLSLLDYLK